MDPQTDKNDFSAAARRSGAPLTDDDVTRLYDAYGMLRRIVAELELAPPLGPNTAANGAAG